MDDNASDTRHENSSGFGRWASRPFHDMREGARAEEYVAGNEFRSAARKVTVDPLRAINQGRKEEEERVGREINRAARTRIADPLRAINDGREEEERIWQASFSRGGNIGRGRHGDFQEGIRGKDQNWRTVLGRAPGPGGQIADDQHPALEDGAPPRLQTAEERWKEDVARLRSSRYRGREPQYISRLEFEETQRRDMDVARTQTDRHHNPVQHWREEARAARKPKGRPKVRNVRQSTMAAQRHPATVPRRKATSAGYNID